MHLKDKVYLILCSLFIFNFISELTAQSFWKITQTEEKPKDKRDTITWCTISREEQKKCEHFLQANERDQIRVGYERIKIACKQASSKDECMALLDEEKATVTTLDAGAVFVGGRYHSLVPIAQEVLEGGFNYYYAVAVIKKGTLDDVFSLHHLRGKKACFAGVQTFAGWILPINTLMKEGGMEIVDCNNHVKSATHYFGPSCAVNCLTDKYNPIGDNSDKLCKLCIGKIPGGRCTDSDPYAGYDGAFDCLQSAGEIAFLKHTTVVERLAAMSFAAPSIDNYQLLCKDGTRKPINEFLACNWGKVPSDAIVTSSVVSFEEREKFQKFFKNFAKRYPKLSGNSTDPKNNIYGNSQPEFDQYGNKAQTQYDQFGNKVQSQYDQFGSNAQTNYDQFGNKVQPEYDQFGNRNRNKRQSFGNLGSQENRNDFNDNRYGNNRQEDNYNQNNNNNPYTQYSGNNQYGSNNYGANDNRDRDRYNDQNEYNRDRYVDPYRTTEQYNQNNDLFARDPHLINPDRYGVNIDPYETDVKYNRPTDVLTESPDIDDNLRFNGTNGTFYEVFSLFVSSPKYGDKANLLFQDTARSIVAVPEARQTYTTFLGDSLQVIMGIRECPVNRMTMCVTSDAEKSKCVKMRTALKAQLLKPEMDCYKGHSQIHCMQAIRSGTADVAVLDASDVYTAGLNFDLIPFVSEVYNLYEPEYYVVAVAKESDPSTEITYLKNKNTCHGGINTAAGWVYPLAFLISNGWIRPYGCNSIRAAAEYFTKSCVPGALSTEYNTGVPYDNMCDLCHGPSFRYCRRDASEDYYGHTGAFRCLVEGGGHVAFVKHTTVTENTGGKKREWWTRDNLNDDYELLCPDGTRAEINEYARCNLGKVKANAIVTRGDSFNDTQLNAYINLFMYAQRFYGRKTTDEFSFSMFNSPPPYSDLIFQDATTQLQIIPPSERRFDRYLGSDFMRARRIVDCHAGTGSVGSSFVILTLSTIFALVILRN